MSDPAARGHYLLLIRLETPAVTRVGARPAVTFPAGWHVYAGSALGSGGLMARLARHQRGEKRPYWHIDWLLAVATIETIWARPGAAGRECAWVEALLALGGQRRPPRFGSGDCRCAGHLVWFAAAPDLAGLRDAAGQPAFQRWPAAPRPGHQA